jgi:diacylglycerol kinase (ATP)
MRKAALLFNSDSGGKRGRRRAELDSVLAMLRDEGIEAELFMPESPAQARGMARQALADGCDTVFAGGGDGTIHNIAQVLANTPIALGILPMGTANALAHDVGLPMNVAAAARAALHGVPRRVPVGRVQFVNLSGEPESRFFVVAAGAGVDAHLFYKLHSGVKQNMGMAAYYAKAWNLWFSHVMIRFRVDFCETGAQVPQSADVTELIAVRIRNFGGVLREFAPGASLDRNDNRLIYCRTASRLAFLYYVTQGLLGRRWKINGIDLAHTERVALGYLDPPPGKRREKIYIEADGELVGTLPAEITAVPDALTLLVPAR